MALTCYLDAHRIALRRLSHDDADMAIAYSHLGSVCFHLGRFTTASRCYRVAVSIRQHVSTYLFYIFSFFQYISHIFFFVF